MSWNTKDAEIIPVFEDTGFLRSEVLLKHYRVEDEAKCRDLYPLLIKSPNERAKKLAPIPHFGLVLQRLAQRFPFAWKTVEHFMHNNDHLAPHIMGSAAIAATFVDYERSGTWCDAFWALWGLHGPPTKKENVLPIEVLLLIYEYVPMESDDRYARDMDVFMTAEIKLSDLNRLLQASFYEVATTETICLRPQPEGTQQNRKAKANGMLEYTIDNIDEDCNWTWEKLQLVKVPGGTDFDMSGCLTCIDLTNVYIPPLALSALLWPIATMLVEPPGSTCDKLFERLHKYHERGFSMRLLKEDPLATEAKSSREGTPYAHIGSKRKRGGQ